MAFLNKIYYNLLGFSGCGAVSQRNQCDMVFVNQFF